MRQGWQFTGFDPDDGAAEYIDEVTGEAYYHRPSWRTPMNDESKPKEPVRSVTIDMAHRFGMEAGPFEAVLRATVIPAETTKEQFAAFLLVARQYNLNPITREIYAFPSRAGGIQPIVGIDGWVRIINEHPQLDGIEFKDHLLDDGNLAAITCRIYRKDRAHPIEVTEYMAECQRPSEPWNKWPARMLRHKALIQCARYAFGFSGIVEPDEFERFNDDGTMTRKTAKPAPLKKGPYKQEDFVKESDYAAPKKVPMAEDAPFQAEWEIGRQAYHKGVSRSQWPKEWSNKGAIRAWQEGWDFSDQEARDKAEPMAAPKKVPLSTQPNPSTDVATAEAAFQLGREAHGRGAGKLGWPGFWRDQANIEAWMRGWSAAEDDMTSARAVDDEISRGND